MIRLDVAKAGAQLFSLNNVFNARVHDGFTPVKVQWVNSTDGNKPLDVKSMKAFLKGRIGQGTIKDDHVELEPKSDLVSWEDDGSGSQPNGITLIKLPPQVFTRDGVFYGYIGLMDASGTVITSINIWFNVDQNVMTAGANVPYYLDEIQAALSAVQSSNDALQRAKQEIDNQINLSKVAFQPEAFENEAALEAKYPAGASGLMVTVDTGHKWLWINGAWKDCGIYQAAGIEDNSVGNKQVSTISASKIIDNQLSPSEAEGQGNINVVGNNEYVMIVSNEVQTSANLVGTFIPLTITNKGTLILTANITSSLDAGYTQALFIADKNKTVLRQLGNVNVPDKNSAINAKESLKITEDPGNYYLLITSKAVGTVTYRKLTVNVSGSPASTVAEEIGDLTAKIDKSPTVTTRAFDTIVHNDVQLDKVSATDGIELTRDVNTITAKVNKANAAGDLQAIFFPVHVQNRNAAFTGTVKVAPIKFPET